MEIELSDFIKEKGLISKLVQMLIFLFGIYVAEREVSQKGPGKYCRFFENKGLVYYDSYIPIPPPS